MDRRESVLLALRSGVGGNPVDPLILRRAIDWLPSRLMPLVADSALGASTPLEPELRGRLAEARRDATLAWMVRARAVSRLNEALRGHAIPAIFLKGVALSEQVFRHPSLRPMQDVDIWVEPERVPGAIESLQKAGFHVPPRYEGSLQGPGESAPTRLEAGFGPAPVFVEMHDLPTSLRACSDRDIADMWARRVSLAEPAMDVLHPEDQLFHICLHFARGHGFAIGLHPLVDITLGLRRWSSDIDWPAWIDRVAVSGATASVWTSLRLANTLLGAAIPAWVLDDPASEVSEALLAEARRQVWFEGQQLPRALERLIGGEAREVGWFRERFWGSHWDATSPRSATPGDWSRGVETVRRVRLDTRQKAREYSWLLTKGQIAQPAFWRGVRNARQRRRMLRLLEIADQTGESATHA